MSPQKIWPIHHIQPGEDTLMQINYIKDPCATHLLLLKAVWQFLLLLKDKYLKSIFF